MIKIKSLDHFYSEILAQEEDDLIIGLQADQLQKKEKKLKEKKKVKALSEMNHTLLIFTANWCESCQYTYSMWLKFANRFSTEKLKIVEVDTSRHDAIARKFQVNFRDGK